MSLRIIATGGTFDKHYDPLSGDLIFLNSVLPEALVPLNTFLCIHYFWGRADEIYPETFMARSITPSS